MNKIITIDGPSGAGKGTITQLVAAHFKWHILDSGALYRIVGVAADQANIDLSMELLSESTKVAITEIARHLDVEFQLNTKTSEVEPFLKGVNLAKLIRTDEAGQLEAVQTRYPSLETTTSQGSCTSHQKPSCRRGQSWKTAKYRRST